MSILDFLRKVMSRWRVVAACALVGVLAALLTLPTPKHHQHVPVPYVVSTRLGASLKTTTADGGGEVSHLAALGLNPQVAQAAATALGGNENPNKLAKSVSYATDFTRNNVVVKAKDLQPERATAVSKAFANALITVAVDEQVSQQQKNEQFLQNQLNSLAQKVKGGNSTASTTTPTTAPAATPTSVAEAGKAPKAATPGEVNRSAGSSTDAIAQAQLNAELSKYTALYGQLQDLESTDATKPPMQILMVGKPTLDRASIKPAPKNISHKLWAAGGLAAGLVIGLIAALILSALDRSLGNPAAFEDAFGLPVLADIPTLSTGARRSGLIVTADRPLSTGAEEYRRLRTALERMPAHIMPVPGGQPAPLGEARDPRSGSRRTDGSIQAVALVGAGPRLGTTTSVANLGPALVEARMRPLLVDLNLRRPQLHRLLRTDASPGVTEEVDGSPPADRDCRLAGVRLVSSGSPVTNPAAYIVRAAGLVAAWRTRADVVVLDVANLASANDLADLVDEVDALVVVCGKRMTTRKDAKATTNVLGVLGAPVLGLLLVDVKPSWQDHLERHLPLRVGTPKAPVESGAGLEPAPAVAATAPSGSAPASVNGGNGAVEAPELVTSPVATTRAPAADEHHPVRITQSATPLPTAGDPPEPRRRRARWRRG